MTGYRLAVAGFIAASFALALWLFANWYDYSMADFDCAGSYWDCHRAVAGRVTLGVGLAVVGWGLWAGLLIRAWKKQ